MHALSQLPEGIFVAAKLPVCKILIEVTVTQFNTEYCLI